MLSFVTWLWGSRYNVEHVNALARMIRRHYGAPHRIICVTNDPGIIDSNIEIVGDRADFAGLVSPHGIASPACYRRLRLFAPDARETFGDIVVNLDLDLIIKRDLRPLLAGFIAQPHVFFAGWRDPYRPKQICGSVFALRTAGYLTDVWSDFKRDPKRAQALAQRAGFSGSDQAWISYATASDSLRWTQADGIYSFKKDRCETLPPDARIVVFHGDPKPWSAEAMRVPWLRAHYR